jgi:uncharacterized protein YodC (DUF2158 family)
MEVQGPDTPNFDCATETVEFRVGDVVRLNSGGPKMTIESIVGEVALCSWMALTYAFGVGRHHFNVATIKKVNAAD